MKKSIALLLLANLIAASPLNATQHGIIYNSGWTAITISFNVHNGDKTQTITIDVPAADWNMDGTNALSLRQTAIKTFDFPDGTVDMASSPSGQMRIEVADRLKPAFDCRPTSGWFGKRNGWFSYLGNDDKDLVIVANWRRLNIKEFISAPGVEYYDNYCYYTYHPLKETKA